MKDRCWLSVDGCQFEDAETAERTLTAGAEAYVLKTVPAEGFSAAIRGN